MFNRLQEVFAIGADVAELPLRAARAIAGEALLGVRRAGEAAVRRLPWNGAEEHEAYSAAKLGAVPSEVPA